MTTAHEPERQHRLQARRAARFQPRAQPWDCGGTNHRSPERAKQKVCRHFSFSFLRPFRAFRFLSFCTQGDALGWIITAPLGLGRVPAGNARAGVVSPGDVASLARPDWLVCHGRLARPCPGLPATTRSLASLHAATPDSRPWTPDSGLSLAPHGRASRPWHTEIFVPARSDTIAQQLTNR